MPENQPQLYEAMFLMDQSAMATDFQGGLDHVRQILERGEAEILSLRKWDERRLAYEIEGQKRGTYLLVLFRANPKQIANFERDVNLSEMILRAMFLRADHMGEVEIEQEINEAQTTRDEAKLRSEGPAESPEEQAEDASEPGPDEEAAAASAEGRPGAG